MTSRYAGVRFFKNLYAIYRDLLEDRDRQYINQWGTTTFTKLAESKAETITEEKIMWQPGDRLDKLASRAYKDSQYWWIIARYNNKPTDAHYKNGDIVRIPHPLLLIKSYYTE